MIEVLEEDAAREEMNGLGGSESRKALTGVNALAFLVVILSYLLIPS